MAGAKYYRNSLSVNLAHSTSWQGETARLLHVAYKLGLIQNQYVSYSDLKRLESYAVKLSWWQKLKKWRL